MKKQNEDRLIQKRNPPQWKLHQQIAHFTKDLDRLPDAQEVRQNPPRSAPRHLLPMVF
ncbi:hypothetical protein KHS38_13895 [Mucilaginibacter sp. Bleaf8]|uniref:hypothetical protein n=1 Tax=Mucilaginibacter sp. Bleaf8 TaxID=2834430 RepID=UPI001BCAC3D0|nr:hypothetical protein [Mucilaginibacter sp. Bleaf8]MBS7565500.1 hypothetical protein [Mucilaginibacter sp. Bleaf8]